MPERPRSARSGRSESHSSRIPQMICTEKSCLVVLQFFKCCLSSFLQAISPSQISTSAVAFTFNFTVASASPFHKCHIHKKKCSCFSFSIIQEKVLFVVFMCPAICSQVCSSLIQFTGWWHVCIWWYCGSPLRGRSGS